MKIQCGFLRRYIPLTQSDEWIADAFVHLGLEVEQVEPCGYCGKGPLVLGQVLEKVPHPQADRLSVCKVAVGSGSPLQIVCGAQNFKVGDRVPVALEGALLGTTVLKKTVLRGIESCGMMCSADELGLASERCKGLLILNETTEPIGTPLETLFGSTRDTLLDLSIPSNRGDCLSYVGLARELSALSGIPVQETPTWASNEASDASNKEDPFTFLHRLPQKDFVQLEAPSCDYFSGCWIENITIQPSPDAIQSFLKSAGLRPINNIVDITNVILLEQGQPLHAFDANAIQGKLHIRLAHPQESLKVLTGKELTLTPETLVVADDQKVLSVAGLMGGYGSRITDATQCIFLECAHFAPSAIRKASQALRLESDSAYRFERFVDKERAPLALMRAIQLLKLTNPTLSPVFFTEAGTAHVPPRTLTVRLDPMSRIMGCPITQKSFQQTLQRLQFQTDLKDPTTLEVAIPSFRPDITQEVDLAEEWIRLQGADTLPSHLPTGSVCPFSDDPSYTLRERQASILSHAGFYECYTDTLQPDTQYRALCLDKPLNEDYACLRYSLVPGLIQALYDNRRYGNKTERLFETGRIFKVDTKGHVCELFATAFVFMPSKKRTWHPEAPFDFYAAKSLVHDLVAASGHTLPLATSESPILWQAGYSSRLGCWEQQGLEVHMGHIDLDFTQKLFKDEVVLAAECMWLPERIRSVPLKTFQAYSNGTVITKDIALWVPIHTPYEAVRKDLVKELKKCLKKPIVLRSLDVFDVFQEPPNERKSFAFSLVFTSDQEALTDETVQSIFDTFQEHIEHNTSYTIRKLN